MRKRYALWFAVITVSFFTLLTCPLFAQQSIHNTEHPPRSLDGYIKMLESSDRGTWQMPQRVVESLVIKDGDVVADIGAGSGYFTGFFSKAVGKNGKVYACDIEKGMIDYLGERVIKEKLDNVSPVLCKPDDPMLPEASVDLIFICDTYHHIGNRDAYISLLMKYLKPGGRLVIVDFQKRETPEGPPVSMRIAREDIVKEITDAGFKLYADFYFLPYQYFLVFAK
ncbi:MAG: methyltransferase domain-containing protein [Candidatus Schekmanbacteria bacterium]|nr:methyltransferase domain-containing protein [Candidatus Schekmanbacteria bacterium]